MNAEIVTIGTELLLGDIVDTNAAYIARSVRNIGLDLYQQTTVGDNEARVAAAIRTALERADVVITTGGSGPTVDDITRQAVAAATDRELEFRADLFDQIAARFQRWGARMSPNNRQQAFVPARAIALENPVGTAPCFIVESKSGCVICLPGVPREMTYMMEHAVLPYLQERMGAPAVILTQVLRTAGIGESQVDSMIQDLERLSNPTVGLAAHAGQTDIRIAAKATTIAEAKALMQPIADDILARLGVHVYGEGDQTVEEVLLGQLSSRGMTMALAEAGIGGAAGERLVATPGAERTVLKALSRDTVDELEVELGITPDDSRSLGERVAAVAERLRVVTQASTSIVTTLHTNPKSHLQITAATNTDTTQRLIERGYGGPPEYAVRWAATVVFDVLRRSVVQNQ